MKEIWIKSENAISKCKNETEKNVIKSLAIIYMINDLETLIPDDNTLKTSLHLSSEEYEKIIDDLVERSIIKRKKITNELDFATIYNREISKEIKRLSESDYYDIDIKETLNEIINPTYSLPRRYNEEYKITRFFSNVFMNERELTALGKFDILFEKNYCDGMIINLIRDSRNIQEIRDYFSQKNNGRLFSGSALFYFGNLGELRVLGKLGGFVNLGGLGVLGFFIGAIFAILENQGGF